MPPAPAPHDDARDAGSLPRPRPRPPATAAVRPKHAVSLRAPGLAAFVRRHPELRKHAAAGAIATGVALFIIASVTAPLAGADVADHGPRHVALAPAVDPALPTPSASAPVQKLLTNKPVHAKSQAPVNHGVISALAANGIPSVALNAYRVAAARMNSVDAGCGVDWALLAGIGREESDHGRYGGAVLHADGISTPRIIGPALDGVHWDYIPAPPNGLALDGDAVYAHALGPMQFIPSTWSIFGTDATGDGKADVFNINDAALGAARYLCAAGGDLRTHAGQVRAVLAYNHSDQYLAQVLALADAYRRGVSITGIPIGITSGALPKINDHGHIPPANPGPPTAVSHDKAAAAPKTTSTPVKSGSPSGSHATSGTTAGGGSSSSTDGGSSSAPSTGGGGSSSSQAPPPPPTSSQPPASPTPSPSQTCHVPLGTICVLP
jgi:membrane-bound lytic murein transglycosylase B